MIIAIVVTVLVAFWIIEPGSFGIQEGLEYKQQAEQPQALEQHLIREQRDNLVVQAQSTATAEMQSLCSFRSCIH